MLRDLMIATALGAWAVLTHAAPPSAPECVPLEEAKVRAERERQALLWSGDEIVIDEAVGNQPQPVAGSTTTVRDALASRLSAAGSAADYARQAVQRGEIPAGTEDSFIATVRKMLYLELQQYGAGAAWVGLAATPLHDGIVWRRQYEFPNASVHGEMQASSTLCIQARLQDVTVWPAQPAATASSLLNAPEHPDCRVAAGSNYTCAGLSKQLQDARIAGERVYASARDSRGGLWIFTVDAPGTRGRALYVYPDGTTLLVDRLTRVKTMV
jgi:hypothetical protein